MHALKTSFPRHSQIVQLHLLLPTSPHIALMNVGLLMLEPYSTTGCDHLKHYSAKLASFYQFNLSSPTPQIVFALLTILN